MRILVPVALAVGIVIATVSGASTEDKHGPFVADGPVLPVEDQTAAAITADIAGQTRLIWVDLSTLHDLGGRRADLPEGAAVRIMLVEQPDGPFREIHYEKVDRMDRGVWETPPSASTASVATATLPMVAPGWAHREDR